MHYNNYWVKNGLVCQKQIENKTLLPSVHYLVTAKEEILSPAEKMVIRYIKTLYEPYRRITSLDIKN